MSTHATKSTHSNNRIILALFAILAFAYMTRIWRLSVPSEFYFDEVYHAFTAKAYAQNDPRGYEWWHQAPEGVAYEWLHPPLAKLMQAGSIRLLGDSSFSWRFPSVLAGVGLIAGLYWLGVLVSNKASVGLLAALIGSLEGLLLVQSRIAMNDMVLSLFVALSVAGYLTYLQQHKQRWWWFAITMAGLGVATKWSAAYLLITLLGWEWLRSVRQEHRWWHLAGWLATFGLGAIAGKIFLTLISTANHPIAPSLTSIGVVLTLASMALFVSHGPKLVTRWFGALAIVVGIYLTSYLQFWLQGHTLTQFVDLHRQIWWYQTSLEATHPYQSQPWQWVFNLRPVWYWVQYSETTKANIYALANPIIAWLAILAVIWSVWRLATNKATGSHAFLTIAALMLFLPWQLSPRIMFFYHYTPSLALMCVLLALGLASLAKLPKGKPAVGIVLTAMVVSFIYFFPHWTGIAVPTSWAEQYFWLSSWK